MFSNSLSEELHRLLEAQLPFALYCLPDGQPALCRPGQIAFTPWPGCELSGRPHSVSTDRELYLQDIRKVADSLADGGKTVISRVICGSWGDSDPIVLASQLFEAFPRCYRTLIYTKETGGWMGASPELLYSRRGNSLSTMALAGTLPQGDTPWDDKNLEEHRLVADHVEQCLQQCGFSYTRHPLGTLNYGTVRHLYTPFEADCGGASLEQFRQLMHPTPAVGGSPRSRALKQIAHTERHSRQLYAGLITLLPDADSEYCIVNLRCMHFDRQHYCIYAGGGITSQSDPTTEWSETQAKAAWFTRALTREGSAT